VARRTASEIYATLTGAGWDPASAVTMTAIALGESSGDNSILGDVGLQDSTWGPSVGLFQIRTQKRQTGSGGLRDINTLLGNDAAQAKAALQISSGGRDFSPWSVFTSGKYRDFLGQAQAAAGGIAAGIGGAAGQAFDWVTGSQSILGGARTIAVEAVFLGLGIGLVWVGVVQALTPAGRKVAGAVTGGVVGT
jgi:hypothetical protein